MNFLALLVAVAMQQVVAPGSRLQGRAWLLRWEGFLGRQAAQPWLRLVLLLATLLLAGHWLLRELADWAFALPTLAATAAMLLWSLGSRDYHTALERFEARQASDPAGAIAATELLWMPAPGRAEGADDGGLETARERLLYAGYARWFAPLFYFVLVGPLAAVAYRATAVLAADGRDAAYLRLLAVLDWVPARLLALTFAVTGDFVAVMQRGADSGLLTAAPPSLLRVCARAACSQGDSARAAADLLFRSAGLWLLLISAVFMLF